MEEVAEMIVANMWLETSYGAVFDIKCVEQECDHTEIHEVGRTSRSGMSNGPSTTEDMSMVLSMYITPCSLPLSHFAKLVRRLHIFGSARISGKYRILLCPRYKPEESRLGWYPWLQNLEFSTTYGTADIRSETEEHVRFHGWIAEKEAGPLRAQSGSWLWP